MARHLVAVLLAHGGGVLPHAHGVDPLVLEAGAEVLGAGQPQLVDLQVQPLQLQQLLVALHHTKPRE